MMRSRLPAIVAVLLLFTGSGAGARQGVPGALAVEPTPPPATLAASWRLSQAVVRGVVTDTRQIASDSTPPDPLLAYTVRIVEVLKNDGTIPAPSAADPAAPVTIEISQIGGSVMVGSTRYVADQAEQVNAAIIDRNVEYIFFLNHSLSSDSYSLSFGRASAFRVDGPLVRVPDLALDMDEIHGQATLPLADVVGLLRAADRQLAEARARAAASRPPSRIRRGLDWPWIGAAAGLPIVVALLVAVPIWIKGDPTIGNVVGGSVVAMSAVFFILREESVLVSLHMMCDREQIPCYVEPSEFTRFGIYAGIGFAQIMLLFLLGLWVETFRRGRTRAKHWR